MESEALRLQLAPLIWSLASMGGLLGIPEELLEER